MTALLGRSPIIQVVLLTIIVYGRMYDWVGRPTQIPTFICGGVEETDACIDLLHTPVSVVLWWASMDK